MLNVAIALTILIYSAFTIMLGGTPFSPIAFFSLFLVTYLFLRFSPARFYLKPNIAIHIIFLISYLIIGASIGSLNNMPPNLGLAAVYVVAVVGSFIFFGLFLLTIGVITLFLRAIAIRSKYLAENLSNINSKNSNLTPSINSENSSKVCPKCDAKILQTLKSGRIVCRNCGWTNHPRKA